MFESILKKLREKIRLRQFVMSLHAVDEMEDDQLSVFDIEHCILSGDIVERQKDKDTNEWKYLINGNSLSNESVEVVAKLSITGKLIIITVYLCE